MSKRGIFHGLCCLCGHACVGAYCAAHAWAAGGRSGSLPSRPAGSSLVVGSCKESPAGRRPLAVESPVQLPAQLRED